MKYRQIAHVCARILAVVTDALFPKRCPVCNGIIPFCAGEICDGCREKLTKVAEPYCLKCGKPLLNEAEYCSDCRNNDHMYIRGRALYVYDSIMRKSIYRFKYYGKREYAKYYGRAMAEEFGRWYKAIGAEALVPVPIHKKRLAARGYNQAELLAEEISRVVGIPVRKDLIERCESTQIMRELSAQDRQNNLKRAFKIKAYDVKLSTIVIIDDIYTTGSTIDAVASCIRGAGVEKIYYSALSIGRGI